NFSTSLHEIIELIPEGDYALAEMLTAVCTTFRDKGESWFEPNMDFVQRLLAQVETLEAQYAIQYLQQKLQAGDVEHVISQHPSLHGNTIFAQKVNPALNKDLQTIGSAIKELSGQISDLKAYQKVEGVQYQGEDLKDHDAFQESMARLYFLLYLYIEHDKRPAPPPSPTQKGRSKISQQTISQQHEQTQITFSQVSNAIGNFSRVHQYKIENWKSIASSIDLQRTSPSYTLYFAHPAYLHRSRTLYIIPCDRYQNIRLPFIREYMRVWTDLKKCPHKAQPYWQHPETGAEVLFVPIHDYTDLASFQAAANFILDQCQNLDPPEGSKGAALGDPIRVVFPLWTPEDKPCTDPIDQFRILRDILEASQDNPDLRAIELTCTVKERLTYARLEAYLEEERKYNPQTRTSFSPDIPGGKDQLDIMHEVEALANLIASEDLRPPLSVGLFGNWGSGKTFFMETLQRQIDAIKGKTEGISENIVHIRFNAWHFVDANLWASIVSNIFQGLNHFFDSRTAEEKQEQALFAELASLKTQQAIAKQAQEELESELHSVNTNIEQLEADRKKKREALEGVTMRDVWGQIKDDPDVNKFLEKAGDRLGYDQIKEIEDKAYGTVDNIQGLLDRYQSTRGRTEKVVLEIFSLKNRKTLIILGLIIAVPILAFYGIQLLPEEEWKPIVSIIGKVAVLVASVGAFVQRVIKFADPVLQNVNKGVDYLNKAKGKIQNLKDIASKQDDQKIALLRQDYEQTELEIRQKEEQREVLEKKKKELHLELEEIKNGKKLDQFILSRLSSNDYQKHLGIISLIRNDFDMLTKLLQEQNHDVQELSEKVEKIGQELHIDRIILYVDDLDRCPPERVVEVLQAVHLILSFPLFVVVVGVDIRWVSKSLLKKYGTMLTNDAHEAGTDAMIKRELRGNATPFDYLEKIFQIPFRLNPISDKQGKIYLASLLEHDVVIEEAPSEDMQEAPIPLQQA
ncbi:MAG: P-loop NTPase fold protein, partial [Bacteroidota bacterium]